ncbi:MAG: hypothetical protein KGY67_01400 [Candidatus Thermoplasmatota archaeon]|nr:hypothetical protein [Candidatus Thermoplasmatota archaeon]
MKSTNHEENMIKKYPAPWSLKGKGFILLYRFSKKEIQTDDFLSQKFKDSFLGGFGAVMIVDYQESNAGPYQELLFIPGNIRYAGKKKKTISKIYVSTLVSKMNGIQNWAIPKEHASFDFKESEKHITQIQVSSKKNNIIDLKLKNGRMKIPVNTKFLPFPLVQEHEDKAFYTKFSGSGTGRLAKVLHLKVNSEMFPKLSEKKPVVSLRVDPFTIHFPKSTIKKIV